MFKEIMEEEEKASVPMAVRAKYSLPRLVLPTHSHSLQFISAEPESYRLQQLSYITGYNLSSTVITVATVIAMKQRAPGNTVTKW